MTFVPRRPEEAILFVGTLFSDAGVFDLAEGILRKSFGNTLLRSEAAPWHFSDYYDKEMPPPLYRNFVFFDSIIDPPSLPDVKLETNRIEELFAMEGRRRINLDPGYVTLAKVVLASKKNYSHRINLGKGVFAELELFYKDGRFNTMPYTYYDYREAGCIAVFTAARGLLRRLASESRTSG